MKDKRPFIVFGSPQIYSEEISEVTDSLEKGWLGTGPKVQRFESDFSDYLGVRNVAAVNSCTAALHLSLLASNLKPGDEVITTPMTFCATINAIIHSRMVPVFADIDPKTLNIDPKEIEKKITKKTKALLIVHFAGMPCDMDAIMYLKKKYNLLLIEDCAHAVETKYKGKKVGTFGDFSCFSFYVTKNVVTGEGGMVVSKSKEGIDRIKIMALHGMSQDAWSRFSDSGYKHYDVVSIGFKYNMMDLQAAIGIHQLKRVEKNWARRAEIWRKYNTAFQDLSVTLPLSVQSSSRHAYHLYTLQIKEAACVTRDAFIVNMHERGIGTGVHYRAIPDHSFYKSMLGFKSSDFPVSKSYGDQTVSIPLSPKLSNKDVDYIIYTVQDLLGQS